ncbi:hypothetical protein Agub_g15549 [Astrephomene gubernaculifera]|uniref:Uncharacterized protein n=1 Tax=Astrephomene gubernaculifera TaxID=47775 RepID=A0AAD3E3E2_9CHLO|nr:hypothetical protein Agub_g15549 [Astrephomene gubernaculifera]
MEHSWKIRLELYPRHTDAYRDLFLKHPIGILLVEKSFPVDPLKFQPNRDRSNRTNVRHYYHDTFQTDSKGVESERVFCSTVEDVMDHMKSLIQLLKAPGDDILDAITKLGIIGDVSYDIGTNMVTWKLSYHCDVTQCPAAPNTQATPATGPQFPVRIGAGQEVLEEPGAGAGPGPSSAAAEGALPRLALEELLISLEVTMKEMMKETVKENNKMMETVKENNKTMKETVKENNKTMKEMVKENNKTMKLVVKEMKDLMRSCSRMEVTASSCSSSVCKRIEEEVGVRWNYITGVHAPCCSGYEPWPAQSKFNWIGNHEDSKENVTGAVHYLQSIAPKGVVVLPVQSIEWLIATVDLGSIDAVIKSSKTDYVFIPEAAWAKCKKDFGAKLVDGWKLSVERGTTTDALRSMIGSIIGLYEAKTERRLNDGLRRVRAQALLEYLAVNHMKDWPTNDVIVLFGDLNTHYVVHAGRKDAGKSKRSIHVASPALLPAVAEHAPAMAADSSSESVTLGFIRALLGTRRTEEAGSPGEGAANSRGGDASGTGEGASGTGEGASGTGEGASGHGRGASSSGGGASGSGDAGSSGGSNDAHGGAGAGSGGGEGSCSSGADSSDGGRGSFDGDEGLLEAARENAYAQAYMSLLRLPEVYEPLGLREPPTSFRPATKEEYLARFRPL